MTNSSDSKGIEQWDLTATLSPFLDRHLVFPLLEYLDTLIADGVISYDSKDVAASRLALLRPTHMVDYATDVYKSIHGETAQVPEEFAQQKEQVYQQLEEFRRGCAPLDELCKDEEQRNKLVASGQWNLSSLAQYNAEITPDMVETYRLLARYMYDCGDYRAARDMLANYIALFAFPPAQAVTEEDEDLIAAGLQQQQQQQQQAATDKETGNASMYYLKSVDDKMLQVLWGRLACEILVEDWEAASVAVDAVRAAMESMVASHKINALQALQQRTWLLHWSLFVYWNDSSAKGGIERLVDLFHSERYKQAITTAAPHLLRYLTAAVLLCKRRVTKKAAAGSPNAEARRLLKNLIHVMQDSEYSDPIVEFVVSLCIKYDFDAAQTKLAECENVLKADFFLCHQTDLFMEEARVFVFENYCRIHHKIDLAALGDQLAMDPDQAEKWIVDLIRNADLDAKIESDERCVVMGLSQTSLYEQVMDRTRDLNVRSATLAQNLTNLLNDARKEKAKRERAAREEY